MKTVVLIFLLPLTIFSQLLTNSTSINITKTWFQEPSGWTYPMIVSVPNTPVPANGYPVCILLHGNGGQGQGMITEFQNNLSCHALIAPTGYQNSWNISNEGSDAPDVEMIADLVNQLQTFSNVDASKIRIIGYSNGSALGNRIFIENNNPGIDMICTMVSQLTEASYHNGNFYAPSGVTDSSLPFCGYDVQITPITGRKYLNICNSNDPVIPYFGGLFMGLTFLDAQQSAFIVANSQGFTGSQLSSGNSIGSGSDVVEEFSYLSDQVVHLKGDAGHGTNEIQIDYLTSYMAVDCNPANIIENSSIKIELFPNPTTDKVQLEIENYDAEIEVYIYDVNGKLVEFATSYSFDLENYPSGFYVFRVIADSFTKEIKLLKQ